MNGKVYTAGTFRGMETLLLEKLEIIRESTPYSPIYILVGSNQLGVYLKRRLACLLSGIFNMHFINFLDLISLIEESVGGEPCQVQPVLAEELIIGEMVNSDEFTSRLSSVAGLKGIGGSLLETFTDLSESGCTGEIADNLVGQLAGSLPSHGNVSVPEVDKKLKAVLELYSIFKERVCKHGGDIHGRFRGAVQLSEKWFPQGNLMVYGFYDFNELQWRLIEAVSGRIETDFFVPWSKVRFFEFVKSTIARFSELAPEIDQTEPKEPQVEEPLEVFLVNTPGEDEEVKETVRTIIDYIKRESISFSDVGIFLTDHDTYIPLFREQLDKAGIPYYYAGRYCDGREQVVSAVLRLLELLDGDFSRSKLVDFMVSAPLKRFEDESAIDPYLRWIRESAEAGITGEDGWLEENNRLIERISDVADQPDRESMNAVRMVGDIISSILETGKQIRSAGSWSESAHIFSSLLRELFSPCKEQEFVCSAVERVGQLDNISTSVSPEVFSQLVRSSLQRCNGSHGSFGDGRVSLLSINRSRGLRFKLVFLVGMTEGRFPGKISQDPWLSDRERDRMNKMSHGDISLSMRGERMLENELLFKLAVDSCSQCLVCSYPRFEEETGRERIPSYFLRFIEDYSVWEKQEITLAVKRISRFGIREDIERAIDQNEYDYATSLSYRGGGSDLPGGLFFQRGVEMVRERRGRKSFTVYDGLLSSDSALKELKSYLREGGWRFSATSLETYASCPFRYFVEKILGMEPLEEPE
jgi:ATP-dependent helicase/DNAse subunit B